MISILKYILEIGPLPLMHTYMYGYMDGKFIVGKSGSDMQVLTPIMHSIL